MMICSPKSREFTHKIFRSFRELPAEWDAFLPGGHALRSDQLAVAELAELADISFLYVLVCRDEEPIAAQYFQSLSAQPGHINSKMIKSWQAKAWTLFTKAACPKLLVAGHLFRHDTSFFYSRPDISSYQAYQCFYTAINIALRDNCASAVLVKDMPGSLIDHFQHNAPEYMSLRNDISMEMDIDPAWQSVHDYEKALKHKYAQRFRKVRQQWAGLEIRELSAAEVDAQKDTIYALYRQVLEHQQVRLGILSPAFLPELKKHYSDKLKVWAVYRDGEMLAFFSAWMKSDALDMFYIGFDYGKNAHLQSYFNILFFAVEQAILHRKPKLILGRTALDAKARLGCEPRYLHTFLYINNPLIRRFVLRKQQNVSLQEGDWEEKHPFRPQGGAK